MLLQSAGQFVIRSEAPEIDERASEESQSETTLAVCVILGILFSKAFIYYSLRNTVRAFGAVLPAARRACRTFKL